MVQSLRGGEGAPPADELQAIRFVGNLPAVRATYRHEVECPGGMFILRTATARGENGLTFADDFRLDEKITEGRMEGIGRGQRQHDLRITGEVDRACRAGTVGETDPP